MTEKQINFLAGPATQAQLKFLKGRFGGQASALRIAIDRAYREETEMYKLTRAERRQLKQEANVTHAKVIKVHRDSNGYPDLLIEAQDPDGFKFRGWWREGEGAIDIKLYSENVDGWPENLVE